MGGIGSKRVFETGKNLNDSVLLGFPVLFAVQEVPDVLLVNLEERRLKLVLPAILRLRST